MDKMEIIKCLKDKGFTVELIETNIDVVYASLNRSVSFMEFEIALDHKVERHQLVRVSSNEVGIICWSE